MILSFLFVTTVLAANPCDGAKIGFWKNTDGSRGGSVASTVKVSAGVIIGPEAQVCGESVVSGKTHIFGRAKISGKAKIHNAKICQSSQINGFDVIDSDYYCQTEDPEPPHPGELGKKTLLGVDSDQDGVRDDVEIWINQIFSNTPTQNKKDFRLAAKVEVSSYGKIMKRISDKDFCINEYRTVLDASRCIRYKHTNGLKNKKDKRTIRRKIFAEQDDLFAEYFNTRERLVEWNKVLKHLDGLVLEGNIKDKSKCDIYLKGL